jgi:hypothetical protein
VAAAVSSVDGPAQEKERKKARAGRLSGDGSRLTGPIGPERGRGRKRSFSFFYLIFQSIFQSFLKFF